MVRLLIGAGLVLAASTVYADDAPICSSSGPSLVNELRCRLAIVERELHNATSVAIVNEARMRMLQDELSKLKTVGKPPT